MTIETLNGQPSPRSVKRSSPSTFTLAIEEAGVVPAQISGRARRIKLHESCLCYVTIEISCTNCDDPERAEGSNPSPSASVGNERLGKVESLITQRRPSP